MLLCHELKFVFLSTWRWLHLRSANSLCSRHYLACRTHTYSITSLGPFSDVEKENDLVVLTRVMHACNSGIDSHPDFVIRNYCRCSRIPVSRRSARTSHLPAAAASPLARATPRSPPLTKRMCLSKSLLIPRSVSMLLRRGSGTTSSV